MHGAIVLAVLALWAQRWFANYPSRRGLIVAFVIVSCSPSGIVATVRGQMAASRSQVITSGHDARGFRPWVARSGPLVVYLFLEVKIKVVRPIP
jgi:hypothetical protein